MAHLVEFQIPLGTKLYQVKCTSCGIRYGIIYYVEVDDTPKFCTFCCHREVANKIEQRES